MWIELQPQSLKSVLAIDEQMALNNVQTPFSVNDILAEECTNVANIWRARIRKYIKVDKRSNYVPSSLLGWILVHLRYCSFTRLPNMQNLLDTLRVKEYEKAMDVLDNLNKYTIEEPEQPEEDTPSGIPSPVVIQEPFKLRWE